MDDTQETKQSCAKNSDKDYSCVKKLSPRDDSRSQKESEAKPLSGARQKQIQHTEHLVEEQNAVQEYGGCYGNGRQRSKHRGGGGGGRGRGGSERMYNNTKSNTPVEHGDQQFANHPQENAPVEKGHKGGRNWGPTGQHHGYKQFKYTPSHNQENIDGTHKGPGGHRHSNKHFTPSHHGASSVDNEGRDHTQENKNHDEHKKYDSEDEDIDPELLEKYKNDKKEDFEFFWRSDCVYSQWHMSGFVVDEKQYVCAEQFMMHRKAMLFEDYKIAREIMKTHSPRKQKSLGRKVQNFCDDMWDANCMAVVKMGNKAKFSQSNDLKNRLFNTYPKILVEASPLDRIWGIGLDARDSRAWNRATWRGKNLLGQALTEVRNEMMREEGMFDGEADTVQQDDKTVKEEKEKAVKQNDRVSKNKNKVIEQAAGTSENEDEEEKLETLAGNKGDKADKQEFGTSKESDGMAQEEDRTPKQEDVPATQGDNAVRKEEEKEAKEENVSVQQEEMSGKEEKEKARKEEHVPTKQEEEKTEENEDVEITREDNNN